MKIVIAVDSYKGSSSAFEISNYIEEGILNIKPDCEVVKLPIADGGEGTVTIFHKVMGGNLVTKMVVGPMGDTIEASYLILPDGTAVIEMAEASGITRVESGKLNPVVATSYGTGQLIKDALDEGCRNFIIGVGGTATNDGGAGIGQALGLKLLDSLGKEIGFGGGELENLASIDDSGLDVRLKKSTIQIASDIDNPICGPNGASYVFGPQKGASKDMVEILDKNLLHYIGVIEQHLGFEIKKMPGLGAGGGANTPLVAFFGAEIKSGVDTILVEIGFDGHITNADLVVTGEGRLDQQSLGGKAPIGVAKRVKAVRGIPVVAIVGSQGADLQKQDLYQSGIDVVVSAVNRIMTLEEAMGNSKSLVIDAAERMMSLIKIGRGLTFK